MQIDVAIIEDEQAFIYKLKDLLNSWAEKHNSILNIHEYTSSENFCFDFEERKNFDVIFIDILLPGSLDGMEIAKLIRKTDDEVAIIFVTGVSSKIGDGYRVSAMQYLIKPVKYADIEECMNKAVSAKRRGTSYLLYRGKNSFVRIPFDDIIYVSSALQYTEFHTAHGVRRQLTRLKDVEAHLPEQFVRCHRSFIVNLEKLNSITPRSIEMSDGTLIPISNAYFASVKDKLALYFRWEL